MLLRFLLCAFLLFACRFSAAADLALERAWVDDPGGTLTLQEVQRLPAQAYRGLLSRGFTRSATWIRLKIAGVPGARAGDTLVVRIRPAYLDEIALFDPLDPAGRPRLTGDHHDWHASEFKSLNHGFLIPASTAPRELWLRMTTTSSSFIHVQVLAADEAQEANRLQEMLYGLMLGALLLFSVWGALQWTMRREALVAVFAFKQMMALVYAAMYLGYGRLLLSGVLETRAIEASANFTFCAYVFFGLVFHYFFLQEFRPDRRLMRIYAVASVAVLAIQIVLLAQGKVQQAMQVNIIAVMLMPVLTIAAAFSCRAWQQADDVRPPLPKWAVVGFYLSMSAVLWGATMPALGLSHAPELNLHLYLIHGLVTGILLIVLLQFRALRIEEARNVAALRARSATQQVEIEKQKSQLQSRFMEMLAHELKTSLSVLHMVFGSAKANPAMLEHGRRTVKNINDLIERCLQAERFEDNEIISHFENFGIDAVVDELLAKLPDAERFSVYMEERFTVNSDWQIYKSVLSNLFDNALKYSPPDSKIQVRVCSGMRDSVRCCELSVENEVAGGAGTSGFPDEAELFKKYYRAGGARKHSGSGLGLYLVANFMRLLGGGVRYERLQHSVRFTVWLPN